MKEYIVICYIIIVTTCASISGEMFDLTIEEIKDSASLIKKISKTDNPLYPYFTNIRHSLTRSDIVNVVNSKIIPTTDFAYNVSKMDEFKTEKDFMNISDTKKREVMVRNRELLTELFPDEIEERNPETIKQTIGLHLQTNKIEHANWLRAEITNFINDVISNDKFMEKWINLKMFFDSSVSDEDIKKINEEICSLDMRKIPVNSIEIRKNKRKDVMDVVIKDKIYRKKNIVFSVSVKSGKKWKIIQAKNIGNNLLQSGYMVKKGVKR